MKIEINNRFHAIAENDSNEEGPTQEDTEEAKRTADMPEKKRRWDKIRKGTKTGQTSKDMGDEAFVNCFLAQYPEHVNVVREQDEYQEIDFMVDSGASDTVIPPNIDPNVELQQSMGSKMGVMYKAANGDEIPNLGEYTLKGQVATQWGWSEEKAVIAQCANITQPLMSVSKLVKNGYQVVFSSQGSYIQNEHTGENIPVTKQNGTYHVKLYVKNERAPGFIRQCCQ